MFLICKWYSEVLEEMEFLFREYYNNFKIFYFILEFFEFIMGKGVYCLVRFVLGSLVVLVLVDGRVMCLYERIFY